MSSDRPSGDPSPAAERGADAADPALVRSRGEPLLEALQQQSPLARDHAESTAAYAFAAAVELGLERRACELVREAARLHEVGQVYAGEPGSLGSHQEETYRLAHGAAIDEEVCGWLLHARERFDGAGPGGMAGAAIPVESRVIRAACDFQRALADPAPDDARPPDRRALDRIQAHAGSELDPAVVEALAAVLSRI